jgi:D-alanyl-D-alanine carboxypeptidase
VRRTGLWLSALVLWWLVPISTGADGRLDRAFAAIDRALRAQPDGPGVAIGVTDRNRTLKIFTHGYADLKTRAPIGESTRFETGSIGKSFTAVALMQLMDEGRFDPQAPIVKYLPWFEMHSNGPPITGHHLLSHTSGFPNYRADAASAAYAAYALRDFEPSYPPGAHFWYSNLGFQTLGYALEAIEGLPTHKVIEHRIFGPLGMRSSIGVITDSARAKLPASYVAETCGSGYVEQPWFEYRAADGSIVSTVADMLAYTRMILNRGAIPGGRLLSERAFTLLTTPVLENYGYGLRVVTEGDDLIIGHGGAIAGFRSGMVAHMNDGFGIVFLRNGPGDDAFGRWVQSAVRGALRGQPIPPPPSAPSEGAKNTPLSTFAGSYVAPGGETVEFTAAAGGLTMHRAGRSVSLERLSTSTFCSSQDDLADYPFAFEQRAGVAVAVSHGPDWFAGKSYEGSKDFPVPPDYLPLVGRYESHTPESTPLRVFVRKGQLIAARGFSEGTPLVKVAANVFRPAEPDFNPERYVFDAVAGGHALRLMVSGEPMYRIDDR